MMFVGEDHVLVRFFYIEYKSVVTKTGFFDRYEILINPLMITS